MHRELLSRHASTFLDYVFFSECDELHAYGQALQLHLFQHIIMFSLIDTQAARARVTTFPLQSDARVFTRTQCRQLPVPPCVRQLRGLCPHLAPVPRADATPRAVLGLVQHPAGDDAGGLLPVHPAEVQGAADRDPRGQPQHGCPAQGRTRPS